MLAVIAEVGEAGRTSLADLKMLAEGFSNLADQQLAAVRQSCHAGEGRAGGRRLPVHPAAPANRIYRDPVDAHLRLDRPRRDSSVADRAGDAGMGASRRMVREKVLGDAGDRHRRERHREQRGADRARVPVLRSAAACRRPRAGATSPHSGPARRSNTRRGLSIVLAPPPG